MGAPDGDVKPARGSWVSRSGAVRQGLSRGERSSAEGGDGADDGIEGRDANDDDPFEDGKSGKDGENVKEKASKKLKKVKEIRVGWPGFTEDVIVGFLFLIGGAVSLLVARSLYGKEVHMIFCRVGQVVYPIQVRDAIQQNSILATIQAAQMAAPKK